MERIRYSKPILSRKQFIKESGYPAAMVDRAIHNEKVSDLFVIRTSDAVNAKVLIVCDEFEWCRRHGDLR